MIRIAWDLLVVLCSIATVACGDNNRGAAAANATDAAVAGIDAADADTTPDAFGASVL